VRFFAGVLAAVLAVTPTAPQPGRPRLLFHLTDSRIGEASGIAAARRSPGIDYLQNDSGDSNRFFAVDARSGVTAATVTVAGATNIDWEDIAVGPDAAGRSSVWLADIGDNDGVRNEVRIYRVPEPRVTRAERGAELRTGPAQVWRLRYPGGPVDAESLAVAPDGTAYVVTKSLLGLSAVYRVPPRPDPRRLQPLPRVGEITLAPHGVANPFGTLGELAVTGAAFSPDGAVFAVRTYAEAYLWRVADGDLAAALRRAPARVSLPRQPQGEGIALIDDTTAVVDSEGRYTAVYSVPVPRVAIPPRPRSTAPVTSDVVASASAVRVAHDADGTPLGWVLAGAALGVAVLGAAVWGWRRGRIRACRSPSKTPP
jgi:hypothetical protein